MLVKKLALAGCRAKPWAELLYLYSSKFSGFQPLTTALALCKCILASLFYYWICKNKTTHRLQIYSNDPSPPFQFAASAAAALYKQKLDHGNSSSSNNSSMYLPPNYREFCHICNKGFLEKRHLHAHLASVHDMKQYKVPCPNCGKFYTRKDNMLVHLKWCKVGTSPGGGQ